MGELQTRHATQKIALVTLAIDDQQGLQTQWHDEASQPLVDHEVLSALAITEMELGRHWQVVKAQSFVADPRYVAIENYPSRVLMPELDGHAMKSSAQLPSDLENARLEADVAKSLAAVTGADLLAVIYSDWTVTTGNFIPTTKALTITVLAIYDAEGRHLYQGRVEHMGQRTLGSFDRAAVDELTVKEWSTAYYRGLLQLLEGA